MSALLPPLPALSLPLPPARVSELHGQALRLPSGRPLAPGDQVDPGDLLRTADGSGGLELSFADGSRVRLAAGSEVRVWPTERAIELRNGRILIQSDRMLGGIKVLTATTILFPEGTTYLAAVYPGGPPMVEVLVLEGAVRATRPRPAPEQGAIVLPGERLRISAAGPLGAPVVRDLLVTLDTEPLIVNFAAPLPSRKRILDLADQQQRDILPGRNQRLRRELGWRRPRNPLALPEMFRPVSPR